MGDSIDHSDLAEADLAVLSEDILSVRPEAIGKTRVLLTVAGGKTEYEEKK